MPAFREHLSYSNLIATTALFIALGSGAWALSKDSIGSRELKKNAVKSAEIADASIKGKDIKNDTLGAQQVSDNGIGAAEIANSAVGSGELADDAVGAAKLANNAVGSSEIANNAVGSSEIATNAVAASEVADGSLTGAEIAANSLTGTQVDESSLGSVANSAAIGGRAFVYGSGNPAATTPEVIATLPALGATLQTDGDSDTDFTVSLKNTGPGTIEMVCPNGGGFVVSGATLPSGVTTGLAMTCLAWTQADPAGPGRSLIFCFNNAAAGAIRCEVLRG